MEEIVVTRIEIIIYNFRHSYFVKYLLPKFRKKLWELIKHIAGYPQRKIIQWIVIRESDRYMRERGKREDFNDIINGNDKDDEEII